MRSEAEIIDELKELCTSTCYVHVVAYLSWRYNFLFFADEVKPQDHARENHFEVLIRTELALLMGLMVQEQFEFSVPEPETFQSLIERTHALLSELHSSVLAGAMPMVKPDGTDGSVQKYVEEMSGRMGTGQFLKETIFYSAESAYQFQYRALGCEKFAPDSEWMVAHKGFSIETAKQVLERIAVLQNEKMNALEFDPDKPEEWTVLPGFQFTIEEVCDALRCPRAEVQNFINAFSIDALPRNQDFKAIGEFNVVAAQPIIQVSEGQYLLLQQYNLLESFYESPFYWMQADKEYRNTAAENRGNFTEKFSLQRLRDVFGAENVYQNVQIRDTLGNDAGEIDVLVTYADRAIILQAKSKKLTVKSRQGDDAAIREDFQKAVQTAYDQGYVCAELIEDGSYTFVAGDGLVLTIRSDFREIYIFCIVSDHYPSLAFQARQFLKHHETETIKPPYVTDVFFLDVLCEFLDAPHLFLSFVHRRIGYFDKLFSSNEYAILSFHLVQNLWINDDNSMVYIGDDVSQDVDAAFYVRRDGFPGNPTPEGILTKFQGTILRQIIDYLGSSKQDGSLDLAFILLSLGEAAAVDINRGLEKIIKATKMDKKRHDLGFFASDTGITIHCNYGVSGVHMKALLAHCTMRKYTQRSPRWFGIAIDVSAGTLAMNGLMLEHPWEEDDALKKAAGKHFKKAGGKTVSAAIRSKLKVGRNDPCPCGSSKKYKKCCL